MDEITYPYLNPDAALAGNEGWWDIPMIVPVIDSLLRWRLYQIGQPGVSHH